MANDIPSDWTPALPCPSLLHVLGEGWASASPHSSLLSVSLLCDCRETWQEVQRSSVWLPGPAGEMLVTSVRRSPQSEKRQRNPGSVHLRDGSGSLMKVLYVLSSLWRSKKCFSFLFTTHVNSPCFSSILNTAGIDWAHSTDTTVRYFNRFVHHWLKLSSSFCSYQKATSLVFETHCLCLKLFSIKTSQQSVDNIISPTQR